MMIATLLTISGALSATVPRPPNVPIWLAGEEPYLPTTSVTNISTASVSAGPVLQIECNANAYGKKLKPPSCRNAARQIIARDRYSVFADRASVVEHDVPLPFRLQSSDGLCYIEIILKDGVTSGRVTSTQFAQAAVTTIQQCVVQWGYGGIVSQIGGDNNLKVIIASAKPNVKCSQQPAPPWRSTVNIFADMVATKHDIVFGRAGSAGVDVPLPFLLKAEDGRAIVRIDSDGRTATSSWYEIWEAVNAVAYMCSTPAARHGGKAAKIGALGNIYLELYDQNPEQIRLGLGYENSSSLLDGVAWYNAGEQSMSLESLSETDRAYRTTVVADG